MLRRLVSRVALPAMVAALATVVAPAPGVNADHDAEPVGDPRYTVSVNPVTGYRLYTPVDLVVIQATPRSASFSPPTTGFDIYDEDLQNSGLTPGVTGASLTDSGGGDCCSWAPFDYEFSFQDRVRSRDFYTHRSRLCIDHLSTARAWDTRQQVTYSVVLNDDHGSWGEVVGVIGFAANQGVWMGACFSNIDTTNKYDMDFANTYNNQGKITGEGNVQND